jgi:hypothetical protein
VAGLTQSEKLCVLEGLSGLGKNLPVQRNTGGFAVDLAQIREKQESRIMVAAKQFRALLPDGRDQAGVVGRISFEVDAVLSAPLGELPHMVLRSPCQVAAEVKDVVVDLVPVRGLE